MKNDGLPHRPLNQFFNPILKNRLNNFVPVGLSLRQRLNEMAEGLKRKVSMR